jgi:hypothetical protein
MINRFLDWCTDQQKPYGFIIWMFVGMSTVMLVSFLVLLIAAYSPVSILAIPVLFVLAFIYSLYKVFM